MKKSKFVFIGAFILASAFFSCKDKKNERVRSFDPTKPIEVTGFYPDSGGIAGPIIVQGKNFGTDTVGLRVLFEDSLGVKHVAGLVSARGDKIYAFIPKLTYLRKLKLIVERKLDDGKVVSSIADNSFFYKTQTTVTTIIGKPEPDNNNVKTLGGDFSSATLSAPSAICLDDEDNIFISERAFGTQQGGSNGQSAKDEKGKNVQSNLVLADSKNQSVIVMKYGAAFSNAPAFSRKKGEEAVYIPEDAGLFFYQMYKSLTYAPRRRSLITDAETKSIIEGNWKYSFVVNANDFMVYTVMWKGQLVRFNPLTRVVEKLLDKVIPDFPNANGKNGSNCYCIFSPIEPDVLYISQEDYNLISRVDISKLSGKDPASYKGEFYTTKAYFEGPINGRGWEDGLLENAKFNAPKQISFTSDGKLYIADTNNHCIRVIDTTVSKEKATVNTAVGLPGNPGFQDGGPEIAKFHFPAGVAVSSDGSEIYVADTKNKVIRKLSIE